MTLKEGLVSWWTLDEESGTRVDSHSSNDLTDNNTVTFQPGKVNNAAEFRVLNDEYLSRASNSELQAGDIDFTWASWAYLYAAGKDANRLIIGKDNGVSGEREYLLKYQLTALDRFQAAVFKATDSGVVVNANNLGSPSVETWYFIVFWHDAGADTLNIQVNNGAVDSVGTGGALQAASDAIFMLGRREFGGITEPFEGLMDETAFWKRLLSSGERSRLWNNSDGLTYSQLPGPGNQAIWLYSKTQKFYNELKKGLIPSWDLQRRYKEVFI